MKIHHIGIACQNIEEGIEEFKKYHNIISQSEIVSDELQNAKLCIVTTDIGINFEFISGDQVSRLLKKGISYYHVCYEVESLDLTIKDFLSKGAVMISAPKPAILFNDRKVSFLYLSYGIVELLEK